MTAAIIAYEAIDEAASIMCQGDAGARDALAKKSAEKWIDEGLRYADEPPTMPESADLALRDTAGEKDQRKRAIAAAARELGIMTAADAADLATDIESTDPGRAFLFWLLTESKALLRLAREARDTGLLDVEAASAQRAANVAPLLSDDSERLRDQIGFAHELERHLRGLLFGFELELGGREGLSGRLAQRAADPGWRDWLAGLGDSNVVGFPGQPGAP